MAWTDIYTLAPARTRAVVRAFLERWATGFEEAASEYEVPQYADRPQAVFRDAPSLIEWLVAEPSEPHAIYWQNTGPGVVRSSMLFFTPDAGLIAGLSLESGDPETISSHLRDLAATVGSETGYAGSEGRPPDDLATFRRCVESAEPPKMVGGVLLHGGSRPGSRQKSRA